MCHEDAKVNVNRERAQAALVGTTFLLQTACCANTQLQGALVGCI